MLLSISYANLQSFNDLFHFWKYGLTIRWPLPISSSANSLRALLDTSRSTSALHQKSYSNVLSYNANIKKREITFFSKKSTNILRFTRKTLQITSLVFVFVFVFCFLIVSSKKKEDLGPSTKLPWIFQFTYNDKAKSTEALSPIHMEGSKITIWYVFKQTSFIAHL